MAKGKAKVFTVEQLRKEIAKLDPATKVVFQVWGSAQITHPKMDRMFDCRHTTGGIYLTQKGLKQARADKAKIRTLGPPVFVIDLE